MNGTPLPTGADSVVTAVSVDGIVRDGAGNAAGNVTATLRDSQKGDTHASDAASLVTCAATDLNGGVDMNGDAANATDVAVTDNPQHNHNEISCVAESGGVASRCATLKGAVGTVASATETSTLSDGTPAAVNVRLVQLQLQHIAA